MLRRPLLTTQEVADLVKVTEPTVRTWIREGKLRGIHISREWRVAVKDLEAFLEARATTVVLPGKCDERTPKPQSSTCANASKGNVKPEGKRAPNKKTE